MVRCCRSSVMAIVLVFLIFRGRDPRGEPSLLSHFKLRISSGKCWVYHHMNKSGGSTIKGMLELWGAYNGVSIGTYSAKTWTQGTERAQSFWDEGYPITVGGYTEIFRARGAADCKWFTVFRHPLPRLVSAYMYCRSPMVKDQLCGSKIVNAREVDIVTFAQHWGNFGLRQFALAFVLPEEVTNSPLAKECPRCAPWYLVKQYLDETDVSKGGGVDEALIRFLEPVKELITNNYAAVGILENFNSTLHLLNRALGIPAMDWPRAFSRNGVRNSRRSDDAEKEKVMEAAASDTRVQSFIRLDIMLYDYALRIHQEQLLDYGLA